MCGVYVLAETIWHFDVVAVTDQKIFSSLSLLLY